MQMLRVSPWGDSSRAFFGPVRVQKRRKKHTSLLFFFGKTAFFACAAGKKMVFCHCWKRLLRLKGGQT
jgi:hypothetical protein